MKTPPPTPRPPSLTAPQEKFRMETALPSPLLMAPRHGPRWGTGATIFEASSARRGAVTIGVGTKERDRGALNVDPWGGCGRLVPAKKKNPQIQKKRKYVRPSRNKDRKKKENFCEAKKTGESKGPMSTKSQPNPLFPSEHRPPGIDRSALACLKGKSPCFGSFRPAGENRIARPRWAKKVVCSPNAPPLSFFRLALIFKTAPAQSPFLATAPPGPPRR